MIVILNSLFNKTLKDMRYLIKYSGGREVSNRWYFLNVGEQSSLIKFRWEIIANNYGTVFWLLTQKRLNSNQMSIDENCVGKRLISKSKLSKCSLTISFKSTRGQMGVIKIWKFLFIQSKINSFKLEQKHLFLLVRTDDRDVLTDYSVEYS